MLVTLETLHGLGGCVLSDPFHSFDPQMSLAVLGIRAAQNPCASTLRTFGRGSYV